MVGDKNTNIHDGIRLYAGKALCLALFVFVFLLPWYQPVSFGLRHLHGLGIFDTGNIFEARGGPRPFFIARHRLAGHDVSGLCSISDGKAQAHSYRHSHVNCPRPSRRRHPPMLLAGIRHFVSIDNALFGGILARRLSRSSNRTDARGSSRKNRRWISASRRGRKVGHEWVRTIRQGPMVDHVMLWQRLGKLLALSHHVRQRGAPFRKEHRVVV